MIGTILAGSLTKNNHLDAGLDITSAEDCIIGAGDSCLISTGLFINVPEGCVGLIWSRSGLSVKYRLEVGAGCIDSGYNGEVKVHLYNHGFESYKVRVGDKIAQLLTIPVILTEYVKVDYFQESDRGDKGFGSSGL
jgi:dUTP pyrophosphatase